MAMTIDKAINILENYYDTFCGYSEDGFCGAVYTAIDIMHKYQKIEQIIKDYDNDKMPEDYWYIDKIREVIEDGKID